MPQKDVMEAIKFEHLSQPEVDFSTIQPEVTEWDEQVFRSITATALTPQQEERIVNPPQVFPKQRDVIAVHWHPEFVPMELIRRRVDRMFPNRETDLIIPTQHNVLTSWGDYSGVEIDCYSQGFNLKVQLLVHFHTDKLKDAKVLKAMLSHTRRYRSSQLFEFIDTILEPEFEDRLTVAAERTGATEHVVRFVRIQVAKLKDLIERHESTMPTDMLKNKLLRHYFDALRAQHNDQLINHAQIFLSAVKKIVKANFSLQYFYRTEEIIEEVRGLGGGVVIPHPEQFWPILLADYDIDGIEVWNPQSRQYTEFLIHCVNRQNQTRRSEDRRLLIFMGDDTHFGEKVLDPAHQDYEKASRELGYQPAWEDLMIRKTLIVADLDRRRLIEDYRARLG